MDQLEILQILMVDKAGKIDRGGLVEQHGGLLRMVVAGRKTIVPTLETDQVEAVLWMLGRWMAMTPLAMLMM